MSTTAARVQTIIATAFGVPASDVLPNVKLTELGADSLDYIELAMEIEDEFGIEIGDDAIAEAATVGQWIEIVERLGGE